MRTVPTIQSELFLARAIAAEQSGNRQAAELLLAAAIDTESFRRKEAK